MKTPNDQATSPVLLVTVSPAAEGSDFATKEPMSHFERDESSDTLLSITTDNQTNELSSVIREKFIGCTIETTLARHTPLALFIGCFMAFLFLLGLSIDRNNKIQATISSADELELQHTWLPQEDEQLKGSFMCGSSRLNHRWRILSLQKRSILHSANNYTSLIRIEVEIHENGVSPNFQAQYTLIGTMEFNPNTTSFPNRILFRASTAKVTKLKGIHEFVPVNWILGAPNSALETHETSRSTVNKWPLWTPDSECQPSKGNYSLKGVQSPRKIGDA